MKVKLTESGLKLFGRGQDRVIANVSMDRAYILMSKNYANADRAFMSLYEQNRDPKKETVMAKPKPKLKPQAKKEQATSKRAAKRSKAVKK